MTKHACVELGSQRYTLPKFHSEFTPEKLLDDPIGKDRNLPTTMTLRGELNGGVQL